MAGFQYWLRDMYGNRHDDRLELIELDGQPNVMCVRLPGIEPGVVMASVVKGELRVMRCGSNASLGFPSSPAFKVKDIGAGDRVVEVEMVPNVSGEDRLVVCLMNIPGLDGVELAATEVTPDVQGVRHPTIHGTEISRPL